MEGIQCLERRIYERPLTSEPFIENQSEHISKLSLHQSLVNLSLLQSAIDVPVNQAEFHCDFYDVSRTRVAI